MFVGITIVAIFSISLESSAGLWPAVAGASRPRTLPHVYFAVSLPTSTIFPSLYRS